MHQPQSMPEACYIAPDTVHATYTRQHMLSERWKAREEEEWVRHNKLNRNIFKK